MQKSTNLIFFLIEDSLEYKKIYIQKNQNCQFSDSEL